MEAEEETDVEAEEEVSDQASVDALVQAVETTAELPATGEERDRRLRATRREDADQETETRATLKAEETMTKVEEEAGTAAEEPTLMARDPEEMDREAVQEEVVAALAQEEVTEAAPSLDLLSLSEAVRASTSQSAT